MLQERVVRCSVGVLYFLRPLRGLDGWSAIFPQACAWGNLDARLRGAFYEGGYDGGISTHYTWEGYFVEALGIR